MVPEPLLHLSTLASAGEWDHALEVVERLSPVEATRVAESGDRAGLRPLLDAVVRRSTAHPDLADVASRRVPAWIRRALAIDRTLARVHGALGRAGTAGLFLKGSCFRETLYPEPWMRAMDDVDVLVPPDRVGAFLSALREAGFVPEAFDPGRPVTHRSMRVRSLMSPDGVMVEVHGGLNYEPWGYRVDPAGLLDRALVVPPSGLPTLAWEDHVLQAAVHLARGGFRQALKHVLDLHRMIVAGVADAAVTRERARAWGCIAALDLGLEAARGTFGTEVPDAWMGAGVGGVRGAALRALVRPSAVDDTVIGTGASVPAAVIVLLMDRAFDRAAFLAFKAGARVLDLGWIAARR